MFSVQQKARWSVSSSQDTSQPRVVADPGMRRSFLPGNREIENGTAFSAVVCTENSIRVDYVTETPNVSGDDRPVLPLPDPVVPNNSIRPDSRGEAESAHYPVRGARDPPFADHTCRRFVQVAAQA